MSADTLVCASMSTTHSHYLYAPALQQYRVLRTYFSPTSLFHTIVGLRLRAAAKNKYIYSSLHAFCDIFRHSHTYTAAGGGAGFFHGCKWKIMGLGAICSSIFLWIKQAARWRECMTRITRSLGWMENYCRPQWMIQKWIKWRVDRAHPHTHIYNYIFSCSMHMEPVCGFAVKRAPMSAWAQWYYRFWFMIWWAHIVKRAWNSLCELHFDSNLWISIYSEHCDRYCFCTLAPYKSSFIFIKIKK